MQIRLWQLIYCCAVLISLTACETQQSELSSTNQADIEDNGLVVAKPASPMPSGIATGTDTDHTLDLVATTTMPNELTQPELVQPALSAVVATQPNVPLSALPATSGTPDEVKQPSPVAPAIPAVTPTPFTAPNRESNSHQTTTANTSPKLTPTRISAKTSPISNEPEPDQVTVQLKSVALPSTLQRQPEQTPIEMQAPVKYHHPVRDAKELTIMLGEDQQGYYLYAEGPIQQGAYNKFIKYVDFYKQQHVKLQRFMMHSNGGLMNEGLQIGNYLHQNGWTTDLDEHMRCYSSCAFIYMGGTHKRFQHGAQLGFHRPYLPNEPDSSEMIAALYTFYSPYWKKVRGSQQLYDQFMMHYGRDNLLMLSDKTVGKYVSVVRY